VDCTVTVDEMGSDSIPDVDASTDIDALLVEMEQVLVLEQRKGLTFAYGCHGAASWAQAVHSGQAL